MIEKILRERILVLDGAMGTMIQKHGLTEHDYRGERFAGHSLALMGNNDLLTLTQPAIIMGIHEAYLKAGADIIETNSFNANVISLADYEMQDLAYELNLEAAKNARKVADVYTAQDKQKPRFVAGSIGPTNKSASFSPDAHDASFRNVSFDELADAYATQIRGLMDGGVDLLLIETVFDTLNAKAALFAAYKVMDEQAKTLPVMLSITLEKNGRTLSGQTIEGFLASLTHFPILSIGFNCSFGASQMMPYLEVLSKKAPCFISAYPNAGLPNQFGKYDQSADMMAEEAQLMLQSGLVNIIGGCCGTSPDHIQAIAAVASQSIPRQIPEIAKETVLSGLEALVVPAAQDCFVPIGERNNVAGSKAFAKLIYEEKFEDALRVARTQVENGAKIIDICMDDAMLDAEKSMVKFLRLIASEMDIAKVPVMIDSSKWEVIEAGLKCVQGKSIVNSISLKEGEDVFLQRADIIKRLGAAVTVMLFDESGQATSYEHKIKVAERSYKLLTEKLKFPPQNIIFDPNVLTIATGIPEHDDYALNFIKACEWITTHLPYAKVCGGVSNLSFAFRGNDALRQAMHTVFLHHATKAGLSMAIVNVNHQQKYEDIDPEFRTLLEDVVLNRKINATETLVQFAEKYKTAKVADQKIKNTWREQPVAERLKYAMINGLTDYLAEDIEELRSVFATPVEIIEKPLMDAMKEVGARFEKGEMFLPQVVKSAQVMRKAVDYLTPYIEAGQTIPTKAGKILMATVKGDVHDIGKNIASVVLSCNGYDIIDLGVMIPQEQIIETAIAEKVDLIGLSGLIAPSLDEMLKVVQGLEERGLDIPVCVGGASTSELHTAVVLSPAYKGGVFHAKDASHGAGVIRALTTPSLKQAFVEETHEHYREVRRMYEEKQQQKQLCSLAEARANKIKIDWTKEAIVKPKFIGSRVIKDFPLQDVAPYIDWRYFFHAWEMKGQKLGTLSDEARKLFLDAHNLLEEIVKEHRIKANVVFGIFPAYSENETVVIRHNEKDYRFDMSRNLLRGAKENNSLADYIQPETGGREDYIGAFAITAGIDLDKEIAKYKETNDTYSVLMLQTLADRLAEALTELMHEFIRKDFWGFAADETLSIQDMFANKYQGLRAAIGYPACPNHQLKRDLFDLLEVEKNIGITLTESYMMNPVSSVCGFIFANKQAKY